MSARYVVVEIDKRGVEASDDVEWATEAEAEAERFTLARVARNNWPELGFTYEVRKVVP